VKLQFKRNMENDDGWNENKLLSVISFLFKIYWQYLFVKKVLPLLTPPVTSEYWYLSFWVCLQMLWKNSWNIKVLKFVVCRASCNSCLLLWAYGIPAVGKPDAVSIYSCQDYLSEKRYSNPQLCRKYFRFCYPQWQTEVRKQCF